MGRTISGVTRINSSVSSSIERLPEKSGPTTGDIAPEAELRRLRIGLARNQSGQHDRLPFAELHGRLGPPRIDAGDAIDRIGAIELAELGRDLHANQIAIEHGRRHDERRAEPVERGLLRPTPSTPTIVGTANSPPDRKLAEWPLTTVSTGSERIVAVPLDMRA